MHAALAACARCTPGPWPRRHARGAARCICYARAETRRQEDALECCLLDVERGALRRTPLCLRNRCFRLSHVLAAARRFGPAPAAATCAPRPSGPRRLDICTQPRFPGPPPSRAATPPATFFTRAKLTEAPSPRSGRRFLPVAATPTVDCGGPPCLTCRRGMCATGAVPSPPPCTERTPPAAHAVRVTRAHSSCACPPSPLAHFFARLFASGRACIAPHMPAAREGKYDATDLRAQRPPGGAANHSCCPTLRRPTHVDLCCEAFARALIRCPVLCIKSPGGSGSLVSGARLRGNRPARLHCTFRPIPHAPFLIPTRARSIAHSLPGCPPLMPCLPAALTAKVE
jgi:hypothetical protein